MSALPDVAAFKSAAQRYEQFTVRLMLATLLATCVYIAVMFAVKTIFKPWLGEVGSEFIPIIAFVLALPSLLIVRAWARHMLRRFPVLSCRHCSQRLTANANIVVASGNCAVCGHHVLATEQRIDVAAAKRHIPLILSEFRVASEEINNRTRTRAISSIVAMFSIFLVVFATVNPAIPFLHDSTRPLFFFGATAMVVGLCVTLFTREVKDQHSLVCPHCAKPLSQSRDIVIATGNCPHCGRRIIKDAKHGA